MTMSVDLLRSEQRFMILTEDLPAFSVAVSKILKPEIFSANQIAQTIYFDSGDYPIPWGCSVKARKYLPAFSPAISLNPEEIHRVEIKFSGKGNERMKVQKELPLNKASEFIGEHLNPFTNGIVLRPYAVDEYRRNHFVSFEDKDLLRLTVDQDVRYGFFEDMSRPALSVGKENFVRVELKTAPEYLSSEEHQKIISLISCFSPLPIISKKWHALHLIRAIIDEKGSPLKKELANREIEAKFNVNHPNSVALFVALKRHFRGESEKYEVPDHYSYSQAGAKINHYWSKEDNSGQLVEGLKTMFAGRRVRPIFKKEVVLLPLSPLGFLLERGEYKGKRFDFVPEAYQDLINKAEKDSRNLNYVGFLNRSRKAFWPENKQTRRVFHVSLDYCRSFDDRVMFQLEVEYVGRYFDHIEDKPEEELKSAITEEVVDLSREIFSFCNKGGQFLTNTVISKFDWLRG